jgi:hypothetical protein
MRDKDDQIACNEASTLPAIMLSTAGSILVLSAIAMKG